MIPSFQEIMLPLLKYLVDGKEHSYSEIVESLSTHFRLTDEEQRELLPSGTQPIFRNRVGWARTYLKHAGLISSPRRAYVQITPRGKELLKEDPSKITVNLLNRYDEFKEFRNRKRQKENVYNANSKQKIPDSAIEDFFDISIAQTGINISGMISIFVKISSREVATIYT